ncbi:quinone-dependent dihydroorotate dehydrogenase [Salinibacter altiplanensis]|uniref:quinone-dependent dihydroorotate dehydrogenase n=1 Tax=Salinibacter altiplanensis TaxID=1803181 RepID=UPI000C9FB677|nr:quinone-dependent dihydroorotate dehydrogenase [Salinibacter altiplanensis]
MYHLLRPLLFRLSPEWAHTASLWAAWVAQRTALPLVASQYQFEDERLRQRLWGNTFPNPVGLAAGADKNARAVPFWEAVGFGFVEVGSVSARPAPGNPTPRAFRLPKDRALINRLGLNNDGAEAVAERLEQRRAARTRPLGINLAKTHDPDIMGEAALEDFRTSFRHLVGQADYVTLNVSCPNTPDGGTFEDPAALDTLLDAIMAEQKAPGLAVPVLVKLSPPFSDRVRFDTRLEEILAVATAHDIDGFIATNTASDRKGVQTSADRLEEIGAGGLSGPPLEARATRLVQYLYRATDGEIPIIGVGGVHDAASAYTKIRAGASLVQLYTALVYEGPGLVQRIKKGLVARLRDDGYASVENVVGVDA